MDEHYITREIGIDLKTCCRCKQEKVRAAFNKRKNTKDGLLHYCRECHQAEGKRQYKKRPEAHKARMKQWTEQNRDKKRALGRSSYWNNRERQIKTHVEANRRRRARALSAGPIDSDITLDKVFVRDKGVCGICQQIVERVISSMDHIKPLSKGGTHTWENVQLAHFNCNAKKGASYD